MPPRAARAHGVKRTPRETSVARLQAYADKALQGVQPSAAEAATLEGDIFLIHTEADFNGKPYSWAAVGEEHLAGLITLFGVALRRSCPVLSTDHHTAYHGLRRRLCHYLTCVREDVIAGHVSAGFILALGQGLVRTHVFRCYAIILADASAQLEQRRTRRNAKAAHDCLMELNYLTSAFMIGSTWVSLDLKAEFNVELRLSRVLEHWARLAMLLCNCEGADRLAAEAISATGVFLLMRCTFMPGLLQDSPCLSYLLCSHVVHLCAALDGGPTYGMPTAAAAEGDTGVAAAAAAAAAEGPIASFHPPPLFNPDMGPLRLQAGDVAGTQLAQWALTLWAFSISTARKELRSAGVCPVVGTGHSPLQSTTPAPAGSSSADGDIAHAGAPCAQASQPAPPGGWAWRQHPWRLQIRPVRAAGVPPIPPPSPPEPLRYWVGCAAVPPLHTRAVCDLSLRLAAAAVEQMQQPAAQRARARGTGGVFAARDDSGYCCSADPAPARVRVAPSQALSLAEKALLCAHLAREDVAVLPSVPGWVRERLERYWRLLLAAAAHTKSFDDEPFVEINCEEWPWGAIRDLLPCLRVPEEALHALPPAPTPDVAAALSAGYLAAVERLLRSVDATGLQLPPLTHTNWLGGYTAFTQSAAAWAQMLAYGPRAAVFSLLATCEKWLRAAVRYGKRHFYDEAGRSIELLVSTVPLRLLLLRLEGSHPVATAQPSPPPPSQKGSGTAVQVEAAAGGSASAAAAAAGAIDSPPGGLGFAQLRLAVSFIAYYMLLYVFKALPFVVCSKAGRSNVTVTPELLGWLPVLEAAAWRRPELEGAMEPVRAAYSHLLAAGFLQAAVTPEDDEGRGRLARALREALLALLHLMPRWLLPKVLRTMGVLVQALSGVVGTEPAAGGSGGGGGGAGEGGASALLRRVLGPGGLVPDPELLAALTRAVAAVEAAGGGGGSSGGDVDGAAAAACDAALGPQPASASELPDELRRWLAAGALMATWEELAAVLPPLCGNSGCTNLAGDSEAGVPLVAVCSRKGCGLVFCSARCFKAHKGCEGTPSDPIVVT